MNPDQLIEELERWAHYERPGTGDWHGQDNEGASYLDGKDDALTSLEQKLAELKEQVKRDAIGRYGS